MNLLASLPSVVGAAAVAPALLILWLVIAAGERPGSPAKVWIAFFLGAASILALGPVRAPFALILAIPENPWLAQALRSVFAVAAPEEIVKIVVIVAVSARRRPFADPMDTVIYGGGGARLCRIRKPRLSGAACGDVALACCFAQRPDRTVSWRARRH